MNKRLVSHRCEKALQEIHAGNKGALADIYDAAGRQMFAVAYTILRDYQLAEDVVQDSLLSICAHAKDVRKGGSALSWIMSIVHNTALNMLRSRQYELFPGEFAENCLGTREMGLSPSSLALEEALRTLDADDRQIVLLKAVVGLSHKEISQIVDIPLAACQKRYQRSLKRLRQELA